MYFSLVLYFVLSIRAYEYDESKMLLDPLIHTSQISKLKLNIESRTSMIRSISHVFVDVTMSGSTRPVLYTTLRRFKYLYSNITIVYDEYYSPEYHALSDDCVCESFTLPCKLTNECIDPFDYVIGSRAFVLGYKVSSELLQLIAIHPIRVMGFIVDSTWFPVHRDYVVLTTYDRKSFVTVPELFLNYRAMFRANPIKMFGSDLTYLNVSLFSSMIKPSKFIPITLPFNAYISYYTLFESAHSSVADINLCYIERPSCRYSLSSRTGKQICMLWPNFPSLPCDIPDGDTRSLRVSYKTVSLESSVPTFPDKIMDSFDYEKFAQLTFQKYMSPLHIKDSFDYVKFARLTFQKYLTSLNTNLSSNDNMKFFKNVIDYQYSVLLNDTKLFEEFRDALVSAANYTFSQEYSYGDKAYRSIFTSALEAILEPFFSLVKLTFNEIWDVFSPVLTTFIMKLLDLVLLVLVDVSLILQKFLVLIEPKLETFFSIIIKLLALILNLILKLYVYVDVRYYFTEYMVIVALVSRYVRSLPAALFIIFVLSLLLGIVRHFPSIVVELLHPDFNVTFNLTKL